MPDLHYHRIERGGNRVGIVLVHGIFGHYRDTWGEFPCLITQDAELNLCDVLCWGYPSRLRPSFGSWLPFLGSKVPGIGLVAEALRTELKNPEIGGNYHDLILVGHSMGGLVIQKMILNALADEPEDRAFLDRIRHILLYATPSEGVQLPRIAKVHQQARSLACDGAFMTRLRQEWLQRVALVQPQVPQEPGRRHIPVRAVLGLEDNAVPEGSARGYHANTLTAPGNHTEVCKPTSRDHTSFQVLKEVVKSSTFPRMIRELGGVAEATLRIVERASQVLFTTGSRSRDPEYLVAIEERLKALPELIHYRILIGPPHLPILKEHLSRLVEIRDSASAKIHQTLHLAIFDDEDRQPEMFLCGNEHTCLVVLPSLTGVGQYSTALLFTEPEVVKGYLYITKQLYEGGRKLEDRASIEGLPIKGLSSPGIS